MRESRATSPLVCCDIYSLFALMIGCVSLFIIAALVDDC